MGRESSGRHSESLNDKNPEIPIIDIDISKIDLSKKRILKAHWVLIDEKEPEPEYEDVYETLPPSDENSIQVGEGWGPRLIGKRNKITGVMVIDFREKIRRKMEEDRQEEEKFSLANFEKQFVKKLFPDIS